MAGPAKPRDPRPPLWKVWFVAARPHTLTASLAPNIVAYHSGIGLLGIGSNANENANENANDLSGWRSLVARWTLFCVLMQLGTNLHNDYADFVKGADNDKRVGQARATQKGWLTPFQTAAASGGTLLSGLLVGAGLVGGLEPTSPLGEKAFAWFVVVSSVFNAFAYTGGPWPLGCLGLPNFSLGYSGLGDLFVFLYFGLVATLFPAWLQMATGTGTARGSGLRASWPPALQVAVLATNIIVVNNLRDRHTDVLAGKKTLAVRFGARFCLVEYGANLAVAYGLALVRGLAPGGPGPSGLLPLLSLPLAWKEWKAICAKEGSALNQHVGGAAKVQLLFCVLLAVSLRKGN